MSHLVRASAALAVLALALPGGAAAKVAKPKHTTTVRTVTVLPKTTAKNLSRTCGKSHSATKIRSRRTSRPTKQRIRTITTYCNGGTRTAFIIRRSTITKTVTVPAPRRAAPATPQPAPQPAKPFRLTLLHNNDGESKYVVGDSIANYGGITRFKTVLDNLRAEADATNVPGTNKGTVTISSGDNFLAGLNLRASFQRFDSGAGPFYDSDAIAAIGYDAVTIGNHEYDFGPARVAEFVAFERSGVPFLSANSDFTQEPILQALRDSGRIADSTVVEKNGERIGIIGVSPPETPSISAPRRVTFSNAVADIVNAEALELTNAGREQDHPVLAPAGLGQRARGRGQDQERRHRHLRRRRRPAGQPQRPAGPGPEFARTRGPVPARSSRTARARTSRSSRPRASTATSAAST